MRPYLTLVGLSLIWGTSFLFIKILVETTEPINVVFLRCLLGAAPLYGILLFRLPKMKVSRLPWFPLLVVGVINAAIPWTLISLSELSIRSSTAAVLNATTPLWTSLFGFALFSVWLSKKQWIGIIVGFVGILILMNFDVASFFNENFIGVGTMVIAAICYGISFQIVKRYLDGVPVLIISAATLTVGFIATGVYSLFTYGFPTSVFLSWEPLSAIIGLGVFGSGLAYLMNFYLVHKAGAEFASFVTYLVPVSAMFWGWLILGEPLSTHLIIGLIFIFGGVYLSGRGKPKNTALEEEKSEKKFAAK
ncbi:MAG TPA: EamA family transporter [Bacillales bacterium]|nr:EamA family transporter [Bacillales bacterium]